MRKEKKYRVTISEKAYTSKPNDKEKKQFVWIPAELSIREIYNHHVNGYTVVGDFGFNTPFRKGRTIDNWRSTPFICIDLDNVPLTWDELCIKLINELPNENLLKPTYIYTTFSHQLEGKGNRYRLVYCFDEAIKSIEQYGEMVTYLNNELSKYLNVTLDECNQSPNQVFFGTHKSANKFYLGIQHSNNLFGAVLNDIKNSDNCQTIDNTQQHTNSTLAKIGKMEKVEYFTKEEKVFLKNQSFTEYLQNNNGKFTIYKNNWYLLGDEALKKDVINIEPKQYYSKGKGGMEYWKINDGKGRKREIKKISRKIHYINPNVTRDELLYNVVYWMYNYTIQGNDPIRWEHLLDIVNTTLNEEASKYMELRLKYLENPNKIERNPSLPKIKTRNKPISIEMQDEAFNAMDNQSIEEIITELNVSQRTAYRIKARNGQKKDNKEKIKKLYMEGIKTKDIIELTGLKKSQVYAIIKLLKEEGINKVEINITNNNINNIGNDAIKYFKDEASMKEFLKRFKTA